MRLPVNDYGFDSQLPENEEESTIENSAKMFDILSNALYKDKILAVIRELSCNARDAHYDAQKQKVPFKLKMPTYLDPSFAVHDEGIGITPAEMRKVYLTYGRSTKTEDNNTIGALGLGSKSPFAYTKSSFIVKTRWHTPPSTEPVQPVTEYVFFIFINTRGRPAMSLVGLEPVDKPMGGLTVEFAVNPGDINLFFHATSKFYRYWADVLPEVIDAEPSQVFNFSVDKVLQGQDWYLERRDMYADFKGAVAVMGNVPYPILADQVNGLPEDLKVIAKNAFVIKFPLGVLEFAPSREDLSYSEFTNKNLIERLQIVRDQVASTFNDQVFATGQTQLEFRKSFHDQITSFTKTMVGYNRYTSDEYVWSVSFLLNGKKPTDTVEYDGYVYRISDLINQTVYVEDADYLPFNIITHEVRGKNNRLYLRPSCQVEAVATEDVDYTLIHPRYDYSRNRKFRAGDRQTFDWQSKLFSPKKNPEDYSGLQNVYLNEDKFTIKTLVKFYMKSADVTFVVNDDGTAGEYKFKCFIEKNVDGEYFFIRHNLKELTVAELAAKVTTFVQNRGLKGAKIIFSSTLDDLRPPIAKVKTDAGTAKLCFHTFSHCAGIKSGHADVAMYKKYPLDKVIIPKYTGHNQKVFKVSDLQSAARPWLYVLKSRAQREIYDPIKGSSIRSMLQYEPYNLTIAITAGFYDDVNYVVDPTSSVRNYTVLVLNEGQIDWLKKRDVKLVSVRDHLKSRLETEFEISNFIEDISYACTMEQLTTIGNFYHHMESDVVERIMQSSHEGYFYKIFKEYVAYKKSTVDHLRSYMLMHLYNKYVDQAARPDTTRSYQISDTLTKNYPLLKMISFSGGIEADVIESLIDYIEMSDNKMGETL